MHLYLMQHGACFSQELDPEQPLSPLGREAVQRSARALRSLGLRFDLILSSPKLRALQTAALAAKAVGCDESDILVTDSVKAMASPRQTLEFLADQNAKHVFIAGHMPHLAKLAALVIGSGGDADLAFENSGLTLVEVTSWRPVQGKLLWHVPPQVLQRIREP